MSHAEISSVAAGPIESEVSVDDLVLTSAPIRPAPSDTASYIADLTTEMAALARGSGLELLAYLLDIAQLEAAATARRLPRRSMRA